MIYQCKHFDIKELVPQETFEQAAHKQYRLWMLFDPELLCIFDALRKRYGVAYINNWAGGRELRGFRPADCTIGAKWSQHKFGRGGDLSFRDQPAEEVRGNIREMTLKRRRKYGFESIRRIEEGVSWLHVDTGNWLPKDRGILFFNP